MKEYLIKIINHYGIEHQLRKFQEEVFELNEAIIRYEEFNNHIENLEVYDIDETELKKEHITEEIADVFNLVEQFMYFYNIDIQDVIEIKHKKIHRQLERIQNEKDNKNN